MKRFLCLLSCCVSLCSAYAQDKTYIIGTEGSYKPYEFIDEHGKLTGFNVELMEAVCAEAKILCKVESIPFDGLIAALQGEKIDVINSSMEITPERAQVIAFSHPIYNSPAIFIMPKGGKIQTDPQSQNINPQSLKGLKIGVQGATTYEKYLKGTLDGVIDLKSYTTQDQALLDLKSGRLDAVLGDEILLKDYLKTEAGLTTVGLSVNDSRFFGNGAGFGFRQKDLKTIDLFNQAFLAVLKNGTYEKIMKKYFDTDIRPKAALK